MPPFLGARVVKGISLDDIAEYVNETALFRNQWQFRPEAGESDDEFKARIRPDRSASSSPRRRRQACSCRRSCTATSPSTATATTSSSGRTAARSIESMPVPLPPPARRAVPLHRRLLPPGRRRGELDYAAFHIVTMGAAVSRGDRRAVRREPLPGLPAAARPRRRDGRGARRVLAPAHPRGVGLRRRGRPDARAGCSASSTAAAATRGATRRAPTSRTTRRSPTCSAPSASASR